MYMSINEGQVRKVKTTVHLYVTKKKNIAKDVLLHVDLMIEWRKKKEKKMLFFLFGFQDVISDEWKEKHLIARNNKKNKN
jgi:hypothetical protein